MAIDTGSLTAGFTQFAQAQAKTPAMASGDKQAARKSAEEFEAVFLNTMLSSMFEGISTEKPFGGGPAEKSYKSVLIGEYAKDIVKTGGLGIADFVYEELLAIQESQKG